MRADDLGWPAWCLPFLLPLLAVQLKIKVAAALLEAGHAAPETIASLARLVPPRLASDHLGQPTEPIFQLRHLILPDKYFVVATAQEVVKLNVDSLINDGVAQLMEVCTLVWQPGLSSNPALKQVLARHILEQYAKEGGRSEAPFLAVPASSAGALATHTLDWKRLWSPLAMSHCYIRPTR